MKTHLTYRLSALITILLILLIGSGTFAQKAPGFVKEKTDTTALNRLNQLKAIVGLSVLQEAELQKIFSGNDLELHQLKARIQQYPPQQRQQYLINFTQQRQIRIMKLLTPEQQQQFRQLIAKRAGSHLPTIAQRNEQYNATLQKLEQPLKGGTFKGMTKGPKS
jgi:hypothetical protein